MRNSGVHPYFLCHQLTSVLGGDIQNWMRPILAFSTLVGAPAPTAFWVKTRPSTNSVSSKVPLQENKIGIFLFIIFKYFLHLTLLCLLRFISVITNDVLFLIFRKLGCYVGGVYTIWKWLIESNLQTIIINFMQNKLYRHLNMAAVHNYRLLQYLAIYMQWSDWLMNFSGTVHQSWMTCWQA